jgi:hypothetical protein
MAARHDKSDIGRREIIAPDVSIALPRHFRSNKMPNQMMDADEGKIVCVGERLREGEPHEQRSDEARPRSDGEPIQIGEPKARFRQRRGNDVRNDANMIPTRTLSCPCTELDTISRPPRRTAAAISSQELSIPRTSPSSGNASPCECEYVMGL